VVQAAPFDGQIAAQVILPHTGDDPVLRDATLAYVGMAVSLLLLIGGSAFLWYGWRARRRRTLTPR